jgi:hypothetical protein
MSSIKTLADLWQLYASEPIPERLLQIVRKPRDGERGDADRLGAMAGVSFNQRADRGAS